MFAAGLTLPLHLFQAAHYAERFQRQQQHDHADPRLLGSFGDRQRTLMLNQRGGGAVGSTTIDVAGQYHHPSSSSEDQQQYRPPPPSCFLVLQVSPTSTHMILHTHSEGPEPGLPEATAATHRSSPPSHCRPSAWCLLLQSVCLLVCWSALHVSLEAMVPLWLLTPWHAGQ